MNLRSVLRLGDLLAGVFFLILLSTPVHPQQHDKTSASPPQVEILGTQSLKITSSMVGQEYDLSINLPRDYADTNKTFPVIYLVDGQWDFPLAQAIFGEQYYDGFVPAAIIVGIAWGGKNPNYDSLRARDLSPTNVKQLPQSGGAPKFLAFIKNELAPFIESRYRTSKGDRTLMGSSFGGLFTLYALFHETNFFNRYVLTSPSVDWDNGILYSYEKTYAEKHSQLPVRLFIGVGGLEAGEVPAVQKFVAQLKSREYKGLELETRVLEGIGHSGSKAEGYTRGLQAVFARPSLMLASKVLERYVGKYQLAPGMTADIVKEHDGLVLVAPGNMKIPLYAESDGNFYVKGMYLFIRFKKNETGKVTGFDAEQFSGQQFVQKVDQ